MKKNKTTITQIKPKYYSYEEFINSPHTKRFIKNMTKFLEERRKWLRYETDIVAAKVKRKEVK